MKNKTNILALLELILLTILIYTRFIRSRTSKFLPLEINMLDCIVLTYICCIFLHIIVYLIKNKPLFNKNLLKSVYINFIIKKKDYIIVPQIELILKISMAPEYYDILNTKLERIRDYFQSTLTIMVMNPSLIGDVSFYYNDYLQDGLNKFRILDNEK